MPPKAVAKPVLVTSEYDVVRASGYKLSGVMVRREDTSDKHVIVMCHGLLSTRDHNFAPTLANELAAITGHHVYRFDFRFEPSEAEPDFRYRFSGFKDDVSDLTQVICKLQSDGFVPWLLLGHSRGANDVLLFASSHAEMFAREPVSTMPASAAASSVVACDKPSHVLAVVALSARYNMPNMWTRLFSEDLRNAVASDGVAPWPTKRGPLVVTAADAEVVTAHMDMKAAVSAIPLDIPILLMHGAEDEVIPAADAIACQADRPSIQLCVVEGARHAFSGKNPGRQLLATVCRFVVEQGARLGVLPAVTP